MNEFYLGELTYIAYFPGHGILDFWSLNHLSVRVHPRTKVGCNLMVIFHLISLLLGEHKQVVCSIAIFHMWQSRIEIEYSVAYFEHITEFDAL